MEKRSLRKKRNCLPGLWSEPELKSKVDIAYSAATGSLSAQRQNLPPDKHINERSSKETGNLGWDTHTELQVQDISPM